MALPQLYLDENLSAAEAGILRGRRYDTLRVQDAGMMGRSDLEQLTCAAGHNRCLVSQNIAEFVSLHAVFTRAQRKA
jgi:predicted nuclease of predicted toxin-antitoxin system